MRKTGTKILVITLIIIILIAGGILAYKVWKDQQQSTNEVVANENVITDEKIEEKKPEKQVQIFSGTDRPIAVMIDNHTGAWPQGGLNDAYMVYEIIVEGGETRLMALFKGASTEKIGPVRSSRHYFLDYAMENDAIYVHFGWSPQAESDITKYSVNNINGITESSTNFWRTKDKSSPHNVATSIEKILSMATKKGYRTTSNKSSVLNYVAEEYDLLNKYSVMDNTTNEIAEQSSTSEVVVVDAIDVVIPHSNLQKVEYKYDETTKRYIRYARNKLQTEWSTKESITTKNIIVEFVDNYELTDSENKGRQGLHNIGTFDGYYITNGKAIKIKCTKTARDEKTIYKDLQGNVIDVNDGNTWINICPKDAKVTLN